MLDERAVQSLIGDMWTLQVSERAWLDRIYDYSKGLRGRPAVPEEAGDEVKDLAKLAVKNVLGLVRDAFAQNLSVVGYRPSLSRENDPAWAMWQRNRMDARQAEVHKPAITYGAAYVTVTRSVDGPVFRPRSPRQLLAVYDDPAVDAWPQYALETWVAQKDAKRRRRGLLYDSTHMYRLDLGVVSDTELVDANRSTPISVVAIDEPEEHGATLNGEPVCPVVRFVNDRDADDMIVGEIAPLIQWQQAINNVNFDRLIVSRFGAFPQKVITGWSGSKSEVLAASARRVWAFDDIDVKATTLAPASLDGYNQLLDSMMEHVAMTAQLSPERVMGKLVNIAADALAAAQATEQRKLAAKRESFGESWEQVLRLAAEMDDDTETASDTEAEVVWRETEARSFAGVVDGITKLAQQGVPIQELLHLVPGMTQQQIGSIRSAMRTAQVGDLVSQLRSAADSARTDPEVFGLASRTEPDAVAN